MADLRTADEKAKAAATALSVQGVPFGLALTIPRMVTATGCTPGNAARFVGPLALTFARRTINTVKRRAAFLGQCAQETWRFANMEENLWYRPDRLVAVWPDRFGPGAGMADPNEYAGDPAALANLVYANRMGNGDIASGDGYRFRGRGCAMLTGREMYTEYGAVNDPDALLLPDGAVDSAGWFWARHDLNALADAWDLAGITRIWNGALNDASMLPARIALSQSSVAALA